MLRSLVILSLEDNEIKSEGCCYLAPALHELTLIEEIWLHINSIGVEGVGYIGNALKQMKCIRKIGLDENDIQNKGMAILCESLMETKSLEVLGVAYNYLNSESSSQIIELLRGKNISVNLTGNNIDKETKQRFTTELPFTNFTF